MNIGTSSYLLLPDRPQTSPTHAPDFGCDRPFGVTDPTTVTTSVSATDRGTSIHGGWQVRITAADDQHPDTVIDRASFDTFAEARQWTTATILYRQAYAPDGWRVSGRITASGNQATPTP